MENVLTEQPFLGKIQVVISKFSSKVKSASYSLAFNGNSAFLRRLIVAVREATPSARSRFLDYSGTHSLCIFAFNFRYTQISAQARLFAQTSFVHFVHFTPSHKTIINCFARQSRKSNKKPPEWEVKFWINNWEREY